MFPIVDAHTHIGLKTYFSRPIPEEKLKKPAFRDPMENSIDNLIASMSANKISRAVTFPYPLDEIDFDLANQYVLQAYQNFSDKIIPFVLPDNKLEKWILKGARGIKQQDILLSPDLFDLDRIYQTASEAGIPVLRHFRSGNGFSVVEQVRQIMGRYPDLKLIIAHMGRGKPNSGEFVVRNLEQLKDFQNVYFETSTVKDKPVIQKAVQLIGPKRILFGTDFPFNSYLEKNPIESELNLILETDLTDKEKRLILGENLLSILNGSPEQLNERSN